MLLSLEKWMRKQILPLVWGNIKAEPFNSGGSIITQGTSINLCTEMYYFTEGVQIFISSIVNLDFVLIHCRVIYKLKYFYIFLGLDS